MTKDDIRLKVNSFIKQGGINYPFHEIISAFDEFFDSNVCIPKGQQRHKYADVLHEMAEDMTKTFQVKYIHQDLGWSTFDSYTDYAFREKPPEPVYECQYVFYDKDKEIARSSFLTEHEYDISCLSFEWLIDVKSKRVRQ